MVVLTDNNQRGGKKTNDLTELQPQLSIQCNQHIHHHLCALVRSHPPVSMSIIAEMLNRKSQYSAIFPPLSPSVFLF